MNKKNTDIENTLPKLPDGFDHGRIVMPDKVRRGTANTLRLYKSDYDVRLVQRVCLLCCGDIRI